MALWDSIGKALSGGIPGLLGGIASGVVNLFAPQQRPRELPPGYQQLNDLLVGNATRGARQLNDISQLYANAGSNATTGPNSALGVILNDLYKQATVNPYATDNDFESFLANQSQKTSDRVNRQIAAQGRYGSGVHTSILANALSELNLGARLQERDKNIQRASAAQQQILGGAQGIAGSQINPALDLGKFLTSPTAPSFGDRLANSLGVGLSTYAELAAAAAEKEEKKQQLEKLTKLLQGLKG